MRKKNKASFPNCHVVKVYRLFDMPTDQREEQKEKEKRVRRLERGKRTTATRSPYDLCDYRENPTKVKTRGKSQKDENYGKIPPLHHNLYINIGMKNMT